MAKSGRIATSMDYSFLKLGGLYDAIVDATVEACGRFGGEKARAVISEFSYWKYQGEPLDQIKKELFDETGLTISDDDIRFLTALDDAKAMIVQTEKHLREACHGR